MFSVSNPYSIKRFLFTFLCLVELSGCATTVADLNRRRSQIKTVESEMKATESALAIIDQYHEFLAKPKGNVVLLGRDALEDSIRQYLPYTFTGRELNKKSLRGQFTLTRVKNFEILSGNRARFQFEFVGKKIQVIVPKKYKSFVSKKDIRQMKASLGSGGTLTIEVVAYYSKTNKALALKAQCTDVKLRKHNTSRHRNELKKGINKKVFRKRKYIPLPPRLLKKGKTIHVLSSPNHLIIMPK